MELVEVAPGMTVDEYWRLVIDVQIREQKGKLEKPDTARLPRPSIHRQ